MMAGRQPFLIGISQNKPVICDLHLTMEEADLLTDYDRIVFLIKNPSDIIEDYCNRADHQDFNCFIHSATNPGLAKARCNKTLEYLNRKTYEQIKRSGYFWLERDGDSTVEDTVCKVEEHFQLRK